MQSKSAALTAFKAEHERAKALRAELNRLNMVGDGNESDDIDSDN